MEGRETEAVGRGYLAGGQEVDLGVGLIHLLPGGKTH